MEQRLLTKIDDAAKMWHKTKDDYYKSLWYQLIKEYANGPHNTKRWPISSDSSHKTDDGWNSFDKRR